ncbi:MAG: hypothetical protein ACTS8W_05095, partial [Arsenophonus sp. NC-PY1-MAG3]
MNIWDNLQIHKHKKNKKLIEEQIQVNRKHHTLFEALNIENYLHTKKTHTHQSLKTKLNLTENYSIYYKEYTRG